MLSIIFFIHILSADEFIKKEAWKLPNQINSYPVSQWKATNNSFLITKIYQKIFAWNLTLSETMPVYVIQSANRSTLSYYFTQKQAIFYNLNNQNSQIISFSNINQHNLYQIQNNQTKFQTSNMYNPNQILSLGQGQQSHQIDLKIYNISCNCITQSHRFQQFYKEISNLILLKYSQQNGAEYIFIMNQQLWSLKLKDKNISKFIQQENLDKFIQVYKTQNEIYILLRKKTQSYTYLIYLYSSKQLYNSFNLSVNNYIANFYNQTHIVFTDGKEFTIKDFKNTKYALLQINSQIFSNCLHISFSDNYVICNKIIYQYNSTSIFIKKNPKTFNLPDIQIKKAWYVNTPNKPYYILYCSDNYIYYYDIITENFQKKQRKTKDCDVLLILKSSYHQYHIITLQNQQNGYIINVRQVQNFNKIQASYDKQLIIQEENQPAQVSANFYQGKIYIQLTYKNQTESYLRKEGDSVILTDIYEFIENDIQKEIRLIKTSDDFTFDMIRPIIFQTSQNISTFVYKYIQNKLYVYNHQGEIKYMFNISLATSIVVIQNTIFILQQKQKFNLYTIYNLEYKNQNINVQSIRNIHVAKIKPLLIFKDYNNFQNFHNFIVVLHNQTHNYYYSCNQVWKQEYISLSSPYDFLYNSTFISFPKIYLSSYRITLAYIDTNRHLKYIFIPILQSKLKYSYQKDLSQYIKKCNTVNLNNQYFETTKKNIFTIQCKSNIQNYIFKYQINWNSQFYTSTLVKYTTSLDTRQHSFNQKGQLIIFQETQFNRLSRFYVYAPFQKIIKIRNNLTYFNASQNGNFILYQQGNTKQIIQYNIIENSEFIINSANDIKNGVVDNTGNLIAFYDGKQSVKIYDISTRTQQQFYNWSKCCQDLYFISNIYILIDEGAKITIKGIHNDDKGSIDNFKVWTASDNIIAYSFDNQHVQFYQIFKQKSALKNISLSSKFKSMRFSQDQKLILQFQNNIFWRYQLTQCNKNQSYNNGQCICAASFSMIDSKCICEDGTYYNNISCIGCSTSFCERCNNKDQCLQRSVGLYLTIVFAILGGLGGLVLGGYIFYKRWKKHKDKKSLLIKVQGNESDVNNIQNMPRP